MYLRWSTTGRKGGNLNLLLKITLILPTQRPPDLYIGVRSNLQSRSNFTIGYGFLAIEGGFIKTMALPTLLILALWLV